MFSVIIPTYNNLKYLKLCLESIKKNSKFDHEIIIYINSSSDGTLEFIKDNSLKHIYNKNNVGLCKAVNEGVKISKNKYIIYAHDDMYFCPDWDVEFYNEIKKIIVKDFFLSGTMIQPFKSFIYLDCGKQVEDFNEKKLLEKYKDIPFNDFQGSTWAPSLIPKDTWNKVGGFSEEYGPGLGSDPDFNMKLWKIGVRLFKGLGNCRVYHFSSISLRKKISNNGSKTFLLKWGISIKFFRKYYLKSDTKFDGILEEPKKNLIYYLDLFKCKLSFIFHKLFNSL
ncbi:glycosyltransferase family 2 protein [Candidatus Pelagibacter sp.]|uniref:glycosyltransferase family 2 protein n=1 Tax=Candidatus Pelagibacter sp. TaxID=2024849 RepID=UPI003F838AE0